MAEAPSSLAMAAAYKLALPAMRAIEELLPQYIYAVEARKKKNESVNEWLAEATACRRCETPFVRVERPEHRDRIHSYRSVQHCRFSRSGS